MIMELIQLKIRLLDLQQRLPIGSTALYVGGQWQLEAMRLMCDIAAYTMKVNDGLHS